MLGKSTGLKLGEVSYLFSFYNITISELLLFSIFFLDSVSPVGKEEETADIHR